MLDEKSIFNVLVNNGYQVMNCNIQSLNIFVKENRDMNMVNILVCLSNNTNQDFFFESLDNIIFQIERKFLFSGILNVNKICLILSDNIERDKKFAEGNTEFWLVDILADRVIIFENQPEDFDGLRLSIENILKTKANKEGSIKLGKMPILTLSILLINIVVFIYLSLVGDTGEANFMLEKGAMYNKTVFKNLEIYRFITCLFLHFDMNHLFSNMMSLFFIGNEVEKIYGKIRFIFIYFFSGIIGSLISVLYYNYIGDSVVSAGASGAVYGLMGAVLVNIIQNKQKESGPIGKIILVIIFLYLAGSSGENVDVFAHLGGLLGGMIISLLCYLFKYFNKNSKRIEK